jgi:PKD repeat protein
VYTQPGTYAVALTASGSGGSSTLVRDAFVLVREPLSASFNVSNPGGVAPVTVAFTDTSRGGAASWSWDFGDGARSSLRHPTHVFATGGTFRVVLTVAGQGQSASAEALVPIGEPPPDARMQAAPTSGDAPLLVQFTDRSLGNITRYEWDFGDGTPFVGERNPAHVYVFPGVYTVRFRVTSAGGVDTVVRRDFITVRLPQKAGGTAAAPTPTVTRDRRQPPP